MQFKNLQEQINTMVSEYENGWIEIPLKSPLALGTLAGKILFDLGSLPTLTDDFELLVLPWERRDVRSRSDAWLALA